MTELRIDSTNDLHLTDEFRLTDQILKIKGIRK